MLNQPGKPANCPVVSRPVRSSSASSMLSTSAPVPGMPASAGRTGRKPRTGNRPGTTIEAAGKICLSMGEQWTAMHLMEVVLLGELGPSAYSDLWTGTGDWSSPEVTAALVTYSDVLDHVNSDASGLTWQDAAQLVANGDAAFNIMGDWVDGDYVAKGFTDYGWAPVPGTDGLYIALSDTFGLPKGAKNAELTKRFLGVLGSKEGQETFNKLKGSICARTDCDYSDFDAYLQSSAADWQVDTILPSVAHGAAASEGSRGRPRNTTP